MLSPRLPGKAQHRTLTGGAGIIAAKASPKLLPRNSPDPPHLRQ